jgi:hypothetical protein
MTVTRDEYGRQVGYCNACGEETLLYTECCDTGEVVPMDEEDWDDAIPETTITTTDDQEGS